MWASSLCVLLVLTIALKWLCWLCQDPLIRTDFPKRKHSAPPAVHLATISSLLWFTIWLGDTHRDIVACAQLSQVCFPGSFCCRLEGGRWTWSTWGVLGHREGTVPHWDVLWVQCWCGGLFPICHLSVCLSCSATRSFSSFLPLKTSACLLFYFSCWRRTSAASYWPLLKTQIYCSLARSKTVPHESDYDLWLVCVCKHWTKTNKLNFAILD